MRKLKLVAIVTVILALLLILLGIIFIFRQKSTYPAKNEVNKFIADDCETKVGSKYLPCRVVVTFQSRPLTAIEVEVQKKKIVELLLQSGFSKDTFVVTVSTTSAKAIIKVPIDQEEVVGKTILSNNPDFVTSYSLIPNISSD